MTLPTNLLDATMLRSLARCPRSFWYRHKRHWAAKHGTSPSATFGIAWHKAMDSVWGDLCQQPPPRSGYGDITTKAEVCARAFQAFDRSWDEQGGLSAQMILASEEIGEAQRRYTPDVAHDMLVAYVEAMAPTLRTWTLLGTETPFVIPLTKDPSPEAPHYFGLIDKIIRTGEGHVIPVDHKTTAAYASQGGFRFDWLDSWSPNGQLTGYVYAASLLHSVVVPYALVDAALVHKTHRHFKLVPVTVTAQNLSDWLISVRAVYAKKLLSEQTDTWEASGMMSSGCQSPFPCAYKDLCIGAFPHKSGAMPASFELRPWEPIKVQE